MAEEQEIKEPEEKEPEVEEEPQGESEEIRDLAMKMGWNPNYEGTDKEPLSAMEFILKGREIQNTSSKHIKKQNREIAELKNGLKGLEDHYKAVYKAQITQLKNDLAELKRQRRAADDDGDEARVKQLDGQINEMEQIPAELPQTPTQIDPRFLTWLDENTWYENDEDLKLYADALGEQPEYRAMAQKNGYENMLNEVTKAVKKMFPQKFQAAAPEVQRRPAAPVETGTRRNPGTKAKVTYKDLTRQQQENADFYSKNGIMTVEEYIEDLKKIGEVS